MNCISGRSFPAKARLRRPINGLRRWLSFVAVSLVVACGGSATETAAADDSREYETAYSVRPDPKNGHIAVQLDLRQTRHLLREVRFSTRDPRFDGFEGDGKLIRDQDVLRWLPPDNGGTLRWRVKVASQRNGDGYDAWLGARWGLFRAEDIIPRAATRTLKGATSTTSLAFELPPEWSVVTQYAEQDGAFPVDHAHRRFSQPAGWIVMGQLGVRRDRIAGIRVAVAAPMDNAVRRLDMLALLNWTLPELARIVPELPARLTIVSAGDPMWRGGLSAPESLYIHAQRPLISENGTSTLLHEVMHVALGLNAVDGSDWIIEGLAEYFSLELLHRSGTLSRSRHERARRAQQEWSQSSTRLCGGRSSGATTARAVAIFIELDEELRQKSDGEHDLDDLVTGLLAARTEIDVDLLDTLSKNLIGENPNALHIDKLPGCRKMAPANNQS